jgi:hypothetical protein
MPLPLIAIIGALFGVATTGYIATTAIQTAYATNPWPTPNNPMLPPEDLSTEDQMREEALASQGASATTGLLGMLPLLLLLFMSRKNNDDKDEPTVIRIGDDE